MARLRLEQVLSNLTYDNASNVLKLTGNSTGSKSFEMTGSIQATGSITVQDIDNFGDLPGYNKIDLGGF